MRHAVLIVILALSSTLATSTTLYDPVPSHPTIGGRRWELYLYAGSSPDNGAASSALAYRNRQRAMERLRRNAIHNRIRIDIHDFNEKDLHGADVTCCCRIVAAYFESCLVRYDVLGQVQYTHFVRAARCMSTPIDWRCRIWYRFT